MKKKTKNKHFSWNPIHPRRDWKRLLIASVALFVLICAWSMYVFLSSSESEGSSAAAPQKVENSNTKALERISTFFEKR